MGWGGVRFLCGLLEGRGVLATMAALWEKREQEEDQKEADLKPSLHLQLEFSMTKDCPLGSHISLSHRTMSS